MASYGRARIDGLVASRANVAMIFRRGPGFWSRGYLWNFDTDELTPGDWIRRKVRSEQCDLSSDGRFLAMKTYADEELRGVFRRGLGSSQPWEARWTMSLAPHYAPIAIWRDSSPMGRGRWIPREGLTIPGGEERAWSRTESGEGTLGPNWEITQPLVDEIANVHNAEHRALMLAMGAPPYDGTPESLRTLQSWSFEQMARHHPLWIVEQPEELTRTFPGGSFVRVRTRSEVRWEARSDRGKVRLVLRPQRSHPQWIDFDRRGRLVYGDRGGLWIWEGFPRGRPKLFADLTEDRPDASTPSLTGVPPLGLAGATKNP